MSPDVQRALLRIAPFLVLSVLVHIGAGVSTQAVWAKLQAELDAARADDSPEADDVEVAWMTLPEVPVPETVDEIVPETRAEEPEPVEARLRRRTRRLRPRARPAPEEPELPEPEEEEPAPELVQTPSPTPPPPPPPETNQQAITQRSADPSVARPENARFIADENSVVQEETVAEIRSLTQDAPTISAGAREERSEIDARGNADETEAAETENEDGADERAATPEEAESDVRGEEGRSEVAAGEEAPEPTPGERGDEGDGNEARASAESPSPREPSGETPTGPRVERVAISDGQGTIYVPVPRDPGGAGGAAGSGRRGRREAPNLRIGWNQYAELMGAENLEADRLARIEQRRSRNRGQSRQQRWERFRAAIENYVPHVRPGNQTALNAAASPFANYLAAVHRRLHTPFRNFRDNLPTYADNPFADPTLRTKLEIILNRDGSVHRVGVTRTSGFLPFDFGAYNAVHRGAPYPEAPAAIVSADGRVYMHWTFYRNERACGTFNAEPYILGGEGQTAPPPGLEDRVDDAEPPATGPAGMPADGALGLAPRSPGLIDRLGALPLAPPDGPRWAWLRPAALPGTRETADRR